MFRADTLFNFKQAFIYFEVVDFSKGREHGSQLKSDEL